MKLHEIESAVRKQFIWAKNAATWRTNRGCELSFLSGMIVMIGVSHMYGFSREEVCNHIGIKESNHARLLETFKGHMKVYTNLEKDHNAEDGFELTVKIWVKVKLVTNAINYYQMFERSVYGRQPFKLEDINF